MKIRTDFVTNSSSSSYIICFARIENEEAAHSIIDKYNLKVFDVKGVEHEKNCFGELGADWCGAVIWSADRVLKEHPDGKFVIIRDRNDAYYSDDCDWEVVYDYDFAMNEAIDAITKENGFADIEVSSGEGRDG